MHSVYSHSRGGSKTFKHCLGPFAAKFRSGRRSRNTIEIGSKSERQSRTNVFYKHFKAFVDPVKVSWQSKYALHIKEFAGALSEM